MPSAQVPQQNLVVTFPGGIGDPSAMRIPTSGGRRRRNNRRNTRKANRKNRRLGCGLMRRNTRRANRRNGCGSMRK